MTRKISEDSMFFGLNLTDEQKEFRDAIYGDSYDIVWCNSKAGSGKTTIAVACAKLLVAEGRYDSLKYIFSPVEEDKLGFTPGEVDTKILKYLSPLYDALLSINENPEQCMCILSNILSKKKGSTWVEAVPHTFMRGSNVSNKVVIIDEVQNFTVSDLKKVLTRCHDNTKVITIGHAGQIDLKKKSDSGFEKYIKHFEGQERSKVCNLTHNFRGWLANWADSSEV